MRQASEYESSAVMVTSATTAREIADEMDAHAVGSVVVVDDEGSAIGIVTDRDLVLRVVAPGRDPDKATASDVMSGNLFTTDRATSTIDLLSQLEEHAVRRVPLMEDGQVAGVVSLDDLVMELGVQLWNVSEAVGSELRESRRGARGRRRRETREDTVEELWHVCLSAGDKVRKRVIGQLREALDKLDQD